MIENQVSFLEAYAHWAKFHKLNIDSYAKLNYVSKIWRLLSFESLYEYSGKKILSKKVEFVPWTRPF